MGEQKLEYKATATPDGIADQLEYIAKGFRDKTIVMTFGSLSLTLEAGEEIKIELDIKKDGGKNKIDLDLTWSDVKEEPAAEAAPEGEAPEEAPAVTEEPKKKEPEKAAAPKKAKKKKKK